MIYDMNKRKRVVHTPGGGRVPRTSDTAVSSIGRKSAVYSPSDGRRDVRDEDLEQRRQLEEEHRYMQQEQRIRMEEEQQRKRSAVSPQPMARPAQSPQNRGCFSDMEINEKFDEDIKPVWVHDDDYPDSDDLTPVEIEFLDLRAIRPDKLRARLMAEGWFDANKEYAQDPDAVEILETIARFYIMDHQKAGDADIFKYLSSHIQPLIIYNPGPKCFLGVKPEYLKQIVGHDAHCLDNLTPFKELSKRLAARIITDLKEIQLRCIAQLNRTMEDKLHHTTEHSILLMLAMKSEAEAELANPGWPEYCKQAFSEMIGTIALYHDAVQDKGSIRNELLSVERFIDEVIPKLPGTIQTPLTQAARLLIGSYTSLNLNERRTYGELTKNADTLLTRLGNRLAENDLLSRITHLRLVNQEIFGNKIQIPQEFAGKLSEIHYSRLLGLASQTLRITIELNLASDDLKEHLQAYLTGYRFDAKSIQKLVTEDLEGPNGFWNHKDLKPRLIQAFEMEKQPNAVEVLIHQFKELFKNEEFLINLKAVTTYKPQGLDEVVPFFI